MQIFKPSLLALAFLAACDGNPFIEVPVDPEDPDAASDFPLVGETENAVRGKAITRVENFDEPSGNGYAQAYIYDPDSDTFLVDNLAFDGENAYEREGTTTTGVAVFRGDEVVVDPDGDLVDQFTYRALYGVSNSGQTEFAIVRTGDYVPYGFGGFIYKRNGGVTLPTQGQASFQGSYTGIRDFSGADTIAGGLEYVTGVAVVNIDFADFNDTEEFLGDGVSIDITDRQIFDINGNNVTQEIVDALNGDTGALVGMPDLLSAVGPGVMSNAGEISSGIFSYNQGVAFETGTYYAVLSGENAEEIVGIVVVEGSDPREDMDGVTVRETGGFIVYN